MTTENQSQEDFLDMSDEEFLNSALPEEEESEEEESQDVTDETQDGDEEASGDEGADEDGDAPASESSSDDELSEEADEEAESGEAEDSDDESGEEQSSEEQSSSDKDEEDEGTSDKEEQSEDNSAVDYKAEYEKLMGPFRANGKDMQVDSIDDARTLMQMGANYNKKMQQLKPALKVIKMLENNDLLDESRVSYLIDLDKKNPEAIRKLIKDAGIDPLDIDTKDDQSYEPTDAYTVDDKELALDNVLSELKDSDGFSKTVDIIGNKWDEPSKQALVDNPSLIRVINEHVELGIYDKIVAVVDRERMMGRLTGLSDIQAYKQVGDMINANGGFKDQQGTSTENTNTSSSEQTNNDKNVDGNKKRDAKRAASFTKAAGKKAGEEKIDVLNMSDEDFEKLPPGKYV